MNQQNAITVLVVVMSAVIPYLISQQDIVIAPVWKVVLTAANIALVALSRFTNPSGEPQQIEISQPVHVTAAPVVEDDGV